MHNFKLLSIYVVLFYLFAFLDLIDVTQSLRWYTAIILAQFIGECVKFHSKTSYLWLNTPREIKPQTATIRIWDSQYSQSHPWCLCFILYAVFFFLFFFWKTWRWVDKASEGANVPSYGASHEGVKPETPCWSVGERTYVLADQSPGGVTPSCAISLLHTFSFVQLHKENTDLWSQSVLPRLWFTRHRILIFFPGTARWLWTQTSWRENHSALHGRS